MVVSQQLPAPNTRQFDFRAMNPGDELNQLNAVDVGNSSPGTSQRITHVRALLTAVWMMPLFAAKPTVPGHGFCHHNNPPCE